MSLIRLASSLTGGLLLLFAVTSVSAQEAKKASGTFKMESTSIALGVGVSWGKGTLNYNGKEYAFKVSGLSVIDLGVSSASVAGEVYDLNKIEDFPGKYVAAGAGIALGGGAGGVIAKNANGVIIRAQSTSQGVQLKLAPEGFTITISD